MHIAADSLYYYAAAAEARTTMILTWTELDVFDALQIPFICESKQHMTGADLRVPFRSAGGAPL